MKDYYVYILTTTHNKTFYVGVTNNMARRMVEHKNEVADGFTKRYHIHKLVYFEKYTDVSDAIRREKQLKGWKRQKKNSLIVAKNPDYHDISQSFI